MSRTLLKKVTTTSRQKSLRNITSTESTNYTGNSGLFPPISSYKSVRARKKMLLVNKRLDGEPLVSGYYKLLKDKSQYSERIQTLKNNMKKIEEIQSKYKYNEPINCKITKNDLIKLEKRAKSIYDQKTRISAAEKIQNWWKRIIVKRKIIDSMQVLNISASIIQQGWRVYFARKKRKIMLNFIKKSAIIIQKCFRGYLTRNKMRLAIKKARMNTIFQYFSDQRNILVRKSALVIRKYWLAYKRRKPAQNELEPAIKISFIENEIKKNNSIATDVLKQGIVLKSQNMKKQLLNSGETHLFGPARARALTDVMFNLETIREVKGK